MTPETITTTLAALFGDAVQSNEPESWQIEQGNLRLLVLLSEDGTWMRSLASICPAQDAEPYFAQLLEDNFDRTLETRYALYQGVLWAVFQHSLAGLTVDDFKGAIARLSALQRQGLSDSFSQLAETQIRQIIRAAKQQGQTLETTMQTLDRFYQEGVMGDLNQGTEGIEAVLGAWRYQLQRLWNEEV
ncbi:MAG TPA: hypothetical protein V6C88_17905 [Chroococcidiopsis sp.]